MDVVLPRGRFVSRPIDFDVAFIGRIATPGTAQNRRGVDLYSNNVLGAPSFSPYRVYLTVREPRSTKSHAAPFASTGSSPRAAPVMIATTWDMVCFCGVVTAARRPRRMIWIRSATSKTWGIS